jgi:hypothetical protein
VGGSCKHSNEAAGSIKCLEVLEYLQNLAASQQRRVKTVINVHRSVLL